MSFSDAFWLNFWSLFATIGFCIVIIGVIIEGVEHFKKFPKKDHARQLHIEKIGWFLVVVGLAMEFLCDHAAKRISDREDARLNDEAGDARKDAGSAIERAAIAEREAGEANERAAKFEFAAKQLEAQIAQTSTNVAKIDPYRTPIFALSAYAQIAVRGESNFLKPKDFKKMKGSPYLTSWPSLSKLKMPNSGNGLPINLFLGQYSEIAKGNMGCLICSDNVTMSIATNGSEQLLRFDIYFGENSFDNSDLFWNSSLTPDAFDAIGLMLPIHCEIIGGDVEMTIDNGLMKKDFQIPKQETSGAFSNEVTSVWTNGSFEPIKFIPKIIPK